MALKIGIITLSASNNCGSCLQAFALKKLLEPYGDVEVINFSSLRSHQMYDIFPSAFWYKHPVRHFIRLLLRYLKRDILKQEQAAYNNFRHNQLGITGREFFASELAEIASKYDIVVAGSDQIWNVRMYDFDEAFFLAWAKCKKASYAASLGNHDIRESPRIKVLTEALKDFEAISVREEKSANLLKEILSEDVPVVLDPTLMLSSEDWENLSGDRPLIDGEYIFYYSWSYSDKVLNNIVSEESRRTKMPVYVIDSRKWIRHSPEDYGFHLSGEQGPLAFLNLMRYAKRCYVESFHGMIFAYIFRRDFWLLDTHKNISDMDTRLRECVNLLNASDRILTHYNYENIDQSRPMVYGGSELLKRTRVLSEKYIHNLFE